MDKETIEAMSKISIKIVELAKGDLFKSLGICCLITDGIRSSFKH